MYTAVKTNNQTKNNVKIPPADFIKNNYCCIEIKMIFRLLGFVLENSSSHAKEHKETMAGGETLIIQSEKKAPAVALPRTITGYGTLYGIQKKSTQGLHRMGCLGEES